MSNTKRKSKTGMVTLLSLFLMVVVVIIIFIVSYYCFLFFVVAMLPALITSVSGNSMNKHTGYTVYAFNLTGVCPYAFSLLYNISSLDDTARLFLHDSMVWLNVYGCTLIGFMVVWLLPIIFARVFTSYSVNEVRKLQLLQKKLLDEWGVEIIAKRKRK